VRRSQAELDAAANADMVVTTCETTAEEIVRVAGFGRARIAVAAPGIFSPPDLSNDPPIAGPYILAVGQVTPRKGFDVLAVAAAHLGPSCPSILVAGPDWWSADEIRRRIDAADTHGKVRLIGPVDDATLVGLYLGATIVCHPSRAEGLGMTCLEAMAAGAPLVASDLPAVRELEDGAGVLVPVNDAEALAEAIGRLLGDEEERRSVAEAGRQRASSYSWERTADHVVRAYRTALGA